MVKRLFPVVALVAVVTILAILAVWGWRRTREAAAFSEPYHVHTHTGADYIIQLRSTTLGRASNEYIVIVTARFENPGSSDLVLQRDWFVLTDHHHEYFQPSTNGAQTAAIHLPPHGVTEHVLLSYHLPAASLNGTLTLLAGQDYWVIVKTAQPFRPNLSNGKFIVFHRRDW